MAALFQRLIQYFASEVVVKGLANNKSFQRFAIRTHTHVEKAKKLVDDPVAQEKALKEARKAAEKLRQLQEGSHGELNSTFARFKRALNDELPKEFGGKKRR